MNRGTHFCTARPAQLLAALVVLASTIVAMAAFNRSIPAVSASRAGLLLSLQPIAGAVTAATVLGEPLRARTTIGGALIVLGIVVTARANRNDTTDGTPPLSGDPQYDQREGVERQAGLSAEPPRERPDPPDESVEEHRGVHVNAD